MSIASKTLLRSLSAVLFATALIANVQARPTDFSRLAAGNAATPVTQVPARNLGAPFTGPRQTIPTVIATADLKPTAAVAVEAARWVGPRNTVPVGR